MATVGESAREARRRRIVERGSDRLALITGRIQSLPPADSSPQQQDVVTASPLLTYDSGRKAIQDDVSIEKIEPVTSNSDQDRNIASRAASLLGVEEEFSRVSSFIQTPASDRQDEQRGHPGSITTDTGSITRGRGSITTGQIRSAIAGSENIRICCSIAAAILVVLAYAGFPILGWRFVSGTLLARPVYLLLLTNVTIVLARLILGTRRLDSKTGQKSSVSMVSGNSLFDQMGKALEAWLLFQNVSGALFMDFGIYAVVLVCGLSFARRLGL